MSEKFPQTNWSQLVLIREHDHPRRAELLDALVRKYWKPVYHYVRGARRLSAEDAEDLTQQFFMTKIAHNDFDRLSRERGSFRAFLKTAVRNFAASAQRSARAAPALFEYREAETEWQTQAEVSADEAYDRAFAWSVLGEAMRTLKQELVSSGRQAHHEAFEAYHLADDDSVTYESLAARLGVSEGQLINYIRVARQRFRAIVRAIVRDYLGPEDDIEAELVLILGKS